MVVTLPLPSARVALAVPHLPKAAGEESSVDLWRGVGDLRPFHWSAEAGAVPPCRDAVLAAPSIGQRLRLGLGQPALT
jgi:hypothetical protein